MTCEMSSGRCPLLKMDSIHIWCSNRTQDSKWEHKKKSINQQITAYLTTKDLLSQQVTHRELHMA